MSGPRWTKAMQSWYEPGSWIAKDAERFRGIVRFASLAALRPKATVVGGVRVEVPRWGVLTSPRRLVELFEQNESWWRRLLDGATARGFLQRTPAGQAGTLYWLPELAAGEETDAPCWAVSGGEPPDLDGIGNVTDAPIDALSKSSEGTGTASQQASLELGQNPNGSDGGTGAPDDTGSTCKRAAKAKARAPKRSRGARSATGFAGVVETAWRAETESSSVQPFGSGKSAGEQCVALNAAAAKMRELGATDAELAEAARLAVGEEFTRKATRPGQLIASQLAGKWHRLAIESLRRRDAYARRLEPTRQSAPPEEPACSYCGSTPIEHDMPGHRCSAPGFRSIPPTEVTA